jgi:hypothetical protein
MMAFQSINARETVIPLPRYLSGIPW